jgi:hypothetical protein
MSALGQLHALPRRSIAVRFTSIKADRQQGGFIATLCAMCGRLRVGKDFLHARRLVGAAMCSAC